jgi:transcriptional antiterminator NusG
MQNMQWYVVHAYSGYEGKVMAALKDRIKESNLESKFGDILVPTEEFLEIRAGHKRKSQRKFFPGYVLVKMEMDEETWYLVRHTPKVLGFIGGSKEQPTPISEKEAEAILSRLNEDEGKPKHKILFEPGDLVRVIDGPFSDFNGCIEEVNYEKNKLKVSVLIFGRSTPVNLNFSQVEKA